MNLQKNNNSNLHDGLLADFAESILIEESKKGPVIPDAPSVESLPPQSQLDIRNIEVPDDFVTTIVEGKSPAPVKKVQPKITETKVDHKELITKFMALLEEGKKLINEMTTCGMIGTTSAPVKPVKKMKKKKTIQEIVNSILTKKG